MPRIPAANFLTKVGCNPTQKDRTWARMVSANKETNRWRHPSMVAARIKRDNPRYEADRNLYSQQNKVKAITFKKWLWAQVKANPVVDFVTYGGKACYPGAEPTVLNTAGNNKLSIELVPGMGEKLSGDVQVKVNGTACTNPTVDEDTLTVTLPVSLDGAELGVITVSADGEVYRLEY